MAFAFTRTIPFAAAKKALTLDRLNRAWNAAMALVTGDEPLDQLRMAKQTHSTTGNQNNVTLNDACGIFVYDAASSAMFTGLTNGRAGRTVRVRVKGAGYLWLRDQNASSTAANRFLCASTNGQYIGKGGSALLTYDELASLWVVHILNPGEPITPTFAAGDYTASGAAVWTVAGGNIGHCTFQQWGKVLRVSMTLNSTSVTAGAGGTALQRILPGGFTATVTAHGPMMRIFDAGAETRGFTLLVGGGSTIMQFYRELTAAWNTAAGNTTIGMPPTFFEVD
jgi:hypothetical protein